MSNDILAPVKRERMTPQDFMIASNEQRGNIAHVKFIPPVIGDRTFGTFDVEYQNAILKPSNQSSISNYVS